MSFTRSLLAHIVTFDIVKKTEQEAVWNIEKQIIDVNIKKQLVELGWFCPNLNEDDQLSTNLTGIGITD